MVDFHKKLLFPDRSRYDPCPGAPGHKEWCHVLESAYAAQDQLLKNADGNPIGTIYNLFALLRERGISIGRTMQGRITKYDLRQGTVDPAEMTRLAKEYLTPNREAVHRVLSLAAFEGRVVE